MIKCIKCGVESEHSICSACADKLLEGMSREDLIAHALVGMDAIVGRKDLSERLKKYKQSLRGTNLGEDD